MNDSLSISVWLPVTPGELFYSWMDGDTHSRMTGSRAEIEPGEGGKFIAWDGYISGVTITIEPLKRIVQSWRTTDFKRDDPDSTLEILFYKEGEGTRLTLNHSGLPTEQSEDYQSGWEEYYFQPMLDYFPNKND
jgi:activator of HSP90 ATPase